MKWEQCSQGWAQPSVEGTEQLLLAAHVEHTQCCQQTENNSDENVRQIKAQVEIVMHQRGAKGAKGHTGARLGGCHAPVCPVTPLQRQQKASGSTKKRILLLMGTKPLPSPGPGCLGLCSPCPGLAPVGKASEEEHWGLLSWSGGSSCCPSFTCWTPGSDTELPYSLSHGWPSWGLW